jgi:predicted DNA-binding transcriptional regulator AlpA
MSPEDFSPKERAPSAASLRNVTLSRWVNERFPAWEQLLSAHHVARLTRRPRWWLLSMAVLGQFPRKQRFHGRGIGWLRSDVLDWMAKDWRMANCRRGAGPNLQRRLISQMKLPMERTTACAARRSRSVCSIRTAIRQ